MLEMLPMRLTLFYLFILSFSSSHSYLAGSYVTLLNSGVLPDSNLKPLLFSSPRLMHCRARRLTNDLYCVTGLMFDNGYVAILLDI
jgi:hypothetical protein